MKGDVKQYRRMVAMIQLTGACPECDDDLDTTRVDGLGMQTYRCRGCGFSTTASDSVRDPEYELGEQDEDEDDPDVIAV